MFNVVNRFLSEQLFKVKTKIIVADFSNGLQIYDAIRDQLAGLDIGVLGRSPGFDIVYLRPTPPLLQKKPQKNPTKPVLLLTFIDPKF
jgi:hypothetical protein